MSINRVNISGNLTRDPDMRCTASGMQVLSFGMAVNDRAKDANGEWVDRPNFIDCSKIEVIVDEIEFMSRREDVAQQQPAPAPVPDEDIPF